jgi:hypothetical protein
MSDPIFNSRSLIPQSFAQRVFRQQVEENAIIEVNNLLATKKIREITYEDIVTIDNRYDTHLRSDFVLNLEEFYAVYLSYCLKDRRLDEDELFNLQQLKYLFGISDKTIEFLHAQIGGAVYRSTFEETVADGKISKEEAAFLEDLNLTLRLPKEFADKISAEVRSGFMSEKISEMTNDFRLSPEEEKELLLISTNLNIRISADNITGKQLQQMKRYWALENLELPTSAIDISVQKEEVCHYKTDHAEWKKVNGRNWSASRYSMNIADGLEVSIEVAYGGRYLEFIDTGVVYLTNKRIILDGQNNRTSIKLEKILRVKLFKDALEIVRETGKNPIILCKNPGELGVLVSRLLHSK